MSEQEPQLGGTPPPAEPTADTATPPVVRVGADGAEIVDGPPSVDHASDRPGEGLALTTGGGVRENDGERVAANEDADRDAGRQADGEQERASHGAEVTPAAGQELERWGAGEKAAGVVLLFEELLTSASDPRGRALARSIAIGRRLGLFNPMFAMFPAFDDHAAWDELAGVVVGLALNLTSDGVELDIDACRRHAAALLRGLVDE